MTFTKALSNIYWTQNAVSHSKLLCANVCAISAVNATKTLRPGLWKIRISHWHCEAAHRTLCCGPAWQQLILLAPVTVIDPLTPHVKQERGIIVVNVFSTVLHTLSLFQQYCTNTTTTTNLISELRDGQNNNTRNLGEQWPIQQHEKCLLKISHSEGQMWGSSKSCRYTSSTS